MSSRLSIVAGFLLVGLSPTAPVRADDLDGSVNPALTLAKSGATDIKKKFVDQRPKGIPPVRLRFDRKVPRRIREQVGSDLIFVDHIQGTGATELHDRIFGRVDGPGYIRWFASRIEEFGFDDDDPNDRAVAYVLEAPKMWLTPLYLKARLPQMERVDTLFHEARHAEPDNNDWPHVKCPVPFQDENGGDIKGLAGFPIAGLKACDDTAVGAYGAGAIMLKNIQRFCANCTDKTRMDAGFYADDDVKRVVGQAYQVIHADLY